MKNTMWKLKNEDEIDESDKSQLQFEYGIQNKNKIHKNPNWAFEVYFRLSKKPKT